ncbi:hypothetical protein PBY51_011349 [Eleginops maclovinus]|uniref:Uncharacterized protein n=1 Tax=Eleginops maclovinus TaxID=56733 RepID=A0AAN8ATM9_ELEMC|nr:hypothetical protein PBY51_011349 [Eleginops maclovinus]
MTPTVTRLDLASFNGRMKLHLGLDGQRALFVFVGRGGGVCLSRTLLRSGKPSVCLRGAPRHKKVTSALTRCFYARGEWQRRGGGFTFDLTGSRSDGGYLQPLNNTGRSGGYEDQVDRGARWWRRSDDVSGLTRRTTGRGDLSTSVRAGPR